MKNIVCFGEALIDFLAEPVLASSSPGTPLPFMRNAGGAPANVSVAIAALGGNAAFVGMLSTDMFGDFLLSSLQEAGVDTQYVVRTNLANTALAFVSLDLHGERSFTFYRPPAADLLFKKEDFRAACFDKLFTFHACSNSLTESSIAEATLMGMKHARQAGALVSFDMNFRPALWAKNSNPLPLLWKSLSEADLIKLSGEEMTYLAHHANGEAAMLARLWKGKAKLLVVTHGSESIRWYTQEANGTAPVFSVNAADIVDTTGAGDAFVAGLLTSLAGREVAAAGLIEFTRTAGLHDALRFAAACGAVAVTRRGAFAAMPSRADIQSFCGNTP